MANNDFSEDNRLDVVILGPMGGTGGNASSAAAIGAAVERILNEKDTQNFLTAKNTTAYTVHIPERWNDNEIIAGVLARLDIADLIIVNLTPVDGPAGAPSANVYYELGLIHALGLPFIALQQTGTLLPFYFRSIRAHPVPDFRADAVAEVLRPLLLQYLDPEDATDFSDNHISQFYEHLPIIDISAAVGLATGYYHNFVGRLLREGSFISTYPDKIKHLVIVRPSTVLDTYEQDKQRLTDILTAAGYTLAEERLAAPRGDTRGAVWFDHVDGIVLDIPRTIYPLKISPRLLAMQDRFDKPRSNPASIKQRDLLLRQMSARLLERVEQAIRYHVNKEREGYRKSLLHYARMEEVPGLLQEFGVAPGG